jgi:hypothetical protein
MFDNIKPIVRQDTRRHGADIVDINYLENYGDDINGAEQIYLFKFYANETNPLFCKIGTTTKTCNTRIRQEIGYYLDHGLAIESVEICKIVQCGNKKAEFVESYLRAILPTVYPNTWRKNDRFFGCDISTEQFTQFCEMYLNM